MALYLFYLWCAGVPSTNTELTLSFTRQTLFCEDLHSLEFIYASLN